jgi:2-oxoglutarate dehydrogenase E1 component
MSFDSQNAELVDQYYRLWSNDPHSVDAEWRAFFEGFSLAGRGSSDTQTDIQVAALRLIYAYRDLGHRSAFLDPLSEPPELDLELRRERYNLSVADLDRVVGTNFADPAMKTTTIGSLLEALRETYAGSIGYEYMHIQNPDVRAWLQERIEPRRSRPDLPSEQRINVLHCLHEAENFEKFLQNRYIGQKRFSLEGAETLIPLLDAFVEKAPQWDIEEYVIGMAHRGRLNVLANVLQKPYSEIFREFEDHFRDDSADGDGDVKYHVGFSSDLHIGDGHSLHVSLTPNPSHLEAVNPVVMGRVRAKQELFHDADHKRGIPILIHGDAAFIGQGSVFETLNMVRLEGYTVGGTLHVIVNNQIGFTTSPTDGRSTRYCTDMAMAIQAPIFHVNAEDPDSVVFIAELALEYRQKFGNDVFIDMICYRRRGHNEGDEPSFTQPEMYRRIAARPSTSKVYTETLIRQNVMTEEDAQRLDDEYQARLDAAQKDMRSQAAKPRGMPRFARRWAGLNPRYTHDPVPTAVSLETIQKVGTALTAVPEGFTAHPKLYDPTPKPPDASSEKKSLLERQRDMVLGSEKFDWGFGEAMAFGTLLLEKTPIRLSGQDSRRGTFSQRHSVLVDQNTGERYTPLNHISTDQAKFSVYDSPLSEYAILGFEYGYSIDDPHTLILWEAQFGDFVNGAQIIIDQFITSSYTKWQRASGLVLLLPHGYEGQGPEHSSARLERFLQACADDNIQVCYPTTPAQYFHMLRRQMKRNFRTPLIVMTPKSLLRHPSAKSGLDEFTGPPFRELIDDAKADPNKVRRVLLCSGKLYYDFYYDSLSDKPGPRAVPEDVAIVRIEQLYPFPDEPVEMLKRKYRKAREWIWAQEEPQNMGAWTFVEPRFRALEIPLEYVGRDASPSPATGSYKIHKREQKELVDVALTGPAPHVVKAVRPAKENRPIDSKPVAATGS